jgi:hypothetical protein
MVRRTCFAFSSHQDCANVVDVGQSRSCLDEIAQPIKKGCSYRAPQELSRIEPGRSRSRKRIRGNQRAGGILGPIDTIAVTGERPDSPSASGRNGKSEQEFGVATAFSGTPIPDRNRRFSARQEDGRRRDRQLVCSHRARDPRHDGSDLAGRRSIGSNQTASSTV